MKSNINKWKNNNCYVLLKLGWCKKSQRLWLQKMNTTYIKLRINVYIVALIQTNMYKIQINLCKNTVYVYYNSHVGTYYIIVIIFFRYSHIRSDVWLNELGKK